MADKNAKQKAATKTEVINRLAEATQLSKKQVVGFFAALETVVREELSKKGPGIVNVLPGLVRVKRVLKPATKDRPGRNPQTGEAITIKGKPKRTVVQVRALKTLKEMVK